MDSSERETEILGLIHEFESILQKAKITKPVDETELEGVSGEDQDPLIYGLPSSQLNKISVLTEQILKKSGTDNGGAIISGILDRFSGRINKSLEQGIVETVVTHKHLIKGRKANLN